MSQHLRLVMPSDRSTSPIEPASPTPAAAPVVFVARQPIMDANRRVFGYELLYRAGPAETRCEADLDRASARVFTDAATMGLETLTGGRFAFINATRLLLMEQAATLLPPASVVVEVLETVAPDAEAVAACRRLRKCGYRIALDDFVYDPRYDPLLEVADFVKVDFLKTTPTQRAEVVARTGGNAQRLIAEKIETQASFDEARQEGFGYYQGFFFSRPVIFTAREVPARALSYMRLLSALNDSRLTAGQLEDLIKQDVSLSLRILTSVNSAAQPIRREIVSMRHAIILLGRQQIRRWASVWVLAGFATGGCQELVTMSLVRARWCELLGERLWGEECSSELFLCGMLSLLDSILGKPIPAILKALPVSDRVSGALCGAPSLWTTLMSCIAAYERGAWEDALALAGAIGLPASELSATHMTALRWAQHLATELRAA
jgi:EAL and modified HD-GYP domain-containing signal transduction protein